MAARQTCDSGLVLSGVVLITVPGRAVADEVAGHDADEVRAVGVAVDLPSELCAVDPCGRTGVRDVMSPVRAAIGCVFPRVIQRDSRYSPQGVVRSTSSRAMSSCG